MAQSCFLVLACSLMESHLGLMESVVRQAEGLEKDYQELQQKVEQQAEQLSQQNQNLQESATDLQRMRSHLVQSEKLSMLGQMLSGISHEINNPINFIYGNLPYVEEHVRDLLTVLQAYQSACPVDTVGVKTALEDVDLEFVLKDLPRVVDSMKVGADRVRELVLTLRNFYRLDEADMRTVDLHEGIDNTLVLLSNRYKQKINIIRQYGNIPLVECHVNQLNQVFMNLIGNAIDALLEDPRELLSIPDAPATLTKQIVIATQQLSTNRIKVTISDNGPGIPLEVQQRLFEPFFTTKPMGIGTGLGLSISYQIVVNTHQGRIYCCSDPSEGTTFIVELPISQERQVAQVTGGTDMTMPMLEAQSNSLC